jgi:hypothetical protein
MRTLAMTLAMAGALALAAIAAPLKDERGVSVETTQPMKRYRVATNDGLSVCHNGSQYLMDALDLMQEKRIQDAIALLSLGDCGRVERGAVIEAAPILGKSKDGSGVWIVRGHLRGRTGYMLSDVHMLSEVE